MKSFVFDTEIQMKSKALEAIKLDFEKISSIEVEAENADNAVKLLKAQIEELTSIVISDQAFEAKKELYQRLYITPPKSFLENNKDVIKSSNDGNHYVHCGYTLTGKIPMTIDGVFYGEQYVDVKTTIQ